MKPVLPQDSRIFRIHALLNLEILFLEAYRFQNPEGLKEYTLLLKSKTETGDLIG